MSLARIACLIGQTRLVRSGADRLLLGGIFLLATSIALFFVLRRKAEDSSSVVPTPPSLPAPGGGSSEGEAVSPAIAHPPLQPIRSILLSRSFSVLGRALILQPVAFSSLYAASSPRNG